MSGKCKGVQGAVLEGWPDEAILRMKELGQKTFCGSSGQRGRFVFGEF